MTTTFQSATLKHKARAWAEAEALYRQALAERPGDAAVRIALATLWLQTGRAQEAADGFEATLPDAPPSSVLTIHQGLAAACRRLGDRARALLHYQALATLEPASAAAALNLGAALADAERYPEAADALARAVQLDAGLAPAREALAVTLNRLGRPAEAEAACRPLLDAAHAGPAAHNALGVALQAQGRLDEAASQFEAALALAPAQLEALYNLGGVLKAQGRTDAALAAFRRLLQAAPDHAPARLALCMAQLPPLYADAAEPPARRAAYVAELSALTAWADRAPPDALADAVGTSQPFDLAYQGEDDVELQRAYGRLVHRAMAARYPPVPLAAAPGAGERLRVGIVSGFFRDHANWRAPVRGWVEGLDRGRFELFGYHTGARQDALTPRIASAFDRFVQGPLSTEAWRTRIAADGPHVLIYPEVGMDPAAVRLAAQRLAPVQCNSWGHPVTSGLPTLDLFLSAADMEPPGAEASYSERLVRLPDLSTALELPQVPPPASRARLGLSEGAPVLWCGQSLYKYLPGDDAVFARIAARVADAQFVFLGFPGSDALTERFRDRLRTAFAAQGLDAERACLILPRLSEADYLAALSSADVVLDSLGWSGCNSVLDALACGLPVVTVEGRRMRGRHASAILRRAGLPQLVCRDVDAYIALAAQLARRPAVRLSLGERADIARRLRDSAAPEALGEVLAAAVHGR